jgi:hypothetical protein
MRTATAALRREVDRLDIKMKEDIATLKHEYIVSSLCIERLLILLQNPDGIRQSEERGKIRL